MGMPMEKLWGCTISTLFPVSLNIDLFIYLYILYEII